MEGVNGASVPEEWRRCDALGAAYIVSSLGRVRNIDTGRILHGEIDKDGYRAVNVKNPFGKKVKRRVHVLVCGAFHGPKPLGKEVAHFDGNRLNNRSSNLRWATRRENMMDAARHGTLVVPGAKGEMHPCAKLSSFNVAEIRHSNEPHRAIARRMGVGESTIRKIRKGVRW